MKKLDPSILKKLKEFKATSNLKREALRVMINTLGEIELKELNEAFYIIDAKGDGIIN